MKSNKTKQINYELFQVAEMYHDEMVGNREHTMVFQMVKSAIDNAKKQMKCKPKIPNQNENT